MVANSARRRRRSQSEGVSATWTIVIGVVLFVFSALALAAGLEDARVLTSETEGWVISADERRVGRGHKCDVDYQYDINGETFHVQTYWDGGCADIRAGSWSTVYYDPDEPEQSSLRNPMDWSEIYLGPIVLFGFGTLIFVPGVVLAKSARRQKH